MLPPPSALLFVPLTLFELRERRRVWTVIMTLCAWGVALYAARFYRLLAGQVTRVEGRADPADRPLPDGDPGDPRRQHHAGRRAADRRGHQ
jgi:hypothetical protein